MTYYKIIVDGSVVDAAFTFLRWDERLNRLLGCEPKDAHFIQSHDGNTVYRAGWLNPVPEAASGLFDTVEAAIIEKQEYLDLRAQLDEGETVPEPVEPEPDPDQPDPGPDQPEEEQPMTVAQMRAKIVELEEQIDMILSGATEEVAVNE